MTTWHTCYPNIAISNDTSHHRRSGHNLESNISLPRTRGWNCERCNRCTSLFHLWVLVSMSYTLAHPTWMMGGVFMKERLQEWKRWHGKWIPFKNSLRNINTGRLFVSFIGNFWWTFDRTLGTSKHRFPSQTLQRNYVSFRNGKHQIALHCLGVYLSVYWECKVKLHTGPWVLKWPNSEWHRCGRNLYC